MKKKIIMLTGGSSGIGRACAEKLIKDGHTVYSCSRTDCTVLGVNNVYLDVLDDASISNAVETIIAQHDKIDVLINCAGSGIGGAVENVPTDALMYQMNINFCATANVCRQVIPHMRKVCDGKIINIGSAAAFFPIPFQAYYSASKAAIHSFSLALRNELAPFNISVTCVHFGDAKTGFTKSRKNYFSGNYFGVDELSIEKMAQDEQNGISSDACASLLCKVVNKRNAAPSYVGGFSYKLLYFAQKILPLGLINRVIRMMYCKKSKA